MAKASNAAGKREGGTQQRFLPQGGAGLEV